MRERQPSRIGNLRVQIRKFNDGMNREADGFQLRAHELISGTSKDSVENDLAFIAVFWPLFKNMESFFDTLARLSGGRKRTQVIPR